MTKTTNCYDEHEYLAFGANFIRDSTTPYFHLYSADLNFLSWNQNL